MKHILLLSLIFTFFILFEANVKAQYPQVKWYYDVNDMSFGNAASGDIDNDGKPEIVFSCYRNDSTVYALNAEDGSLLWKLNTGGCNDVAPLIYDVDADGEMEVIVPSSCVAKTFCIDGDSGIIEWETITHGSDSPPTIADVDNDGKLEILHGEFSGYVICINAEDGSIAWEISVDANSWIQTAPVILDIDQDNQLDFVVGNWNFDTAHRIFAYQGNNHVLHWSTTLPDDYMYHGAAVADIDYDGKPELAIGSYDGFLYVLNGEDGSLLWSYSLPGSSYIGGPVSIADIDNDARYEIVFCDNASIAAVSDSGTLKWEYAIPGYGTAFRGVALSDINGDSYIDVIFGTSKGEAIALNGNDGSEIWRYSLKQHFGGSFDIDHGPIVADFDNNSEMDVFMVGGYANYPNIYNNYGRAYALSAGMGNGPDWPMFRRDERRTACIPLANTAIPKYFVHKNKKVSIHPNPATRLCYIVFDAERAQQIQLSIMNIHGKSVQEKRIGLYKGVNKIKLDLLNDQGNRFPPGIYQIIFSNGSTRIAKKLVIL